MRDGLEAVGCDMGVRTLALWRRLQDRNHDRWVGGGWVCYGSVRCECVSARFCAFLRAPLYFVAWRLVAVWFCGVSCGRVCAAVGQLIMQLIACRASDQEEWFVPLVL